MPGRQAEEENSTIDLYAECSDIRRTITLLSVEMGELRNMLEAEKAKSTTFHEEVATFTSVCAELLVQMGDEIHSLPITMRGNN